MTRFVALVLGLAACLFEASCISMQYFADRESRRRHYVEAIHSLSAHPTRAELSVALSPSGPPKRLNEIFSISGGVLLDPLHEVYPLDKDFELLAEIHYARLSLDMRTITINSPQRADDTFDKASLKVQRLGTSPTVTSM